MADLSKYVKAITVQTNYLPDMVITDPFAPGAPVPNPMLQALQPKITVSLDISGIQKDVVVTPYGEPGPTKWPLIKTAGLVLLIGFLSYGVFRQLKK